MPRNGRAYRDIVLGVKTNNLQFGNIEAIVVSVDQTVNEKVLFTCEVNANLLCLSHIHNTIIRAVYLPYVL